MPEIPPHSPIPDLASNDFGNLALADGGPVDTPAPAVDTTESSQDQEGAEGVEPVEPDNTLSSSSVEHPSESDTVHPQRVHNLHHVLRIICLEIQFIAIKTLLRYRTSEQTTLQIIIELLVSLHSEINSSCHLQIFRHITIILT